MNTRLLPADTLRPDAGTLAEAAQTLRAGGLVAFPTETVYGLGATLPYAARIFAAKGRPATNPLIVHVADTDAVLPLVTCWPEHAQRLAEAFWPGPLTLVLPRSSRVPDTVTAGGSTVAVRVPSHPVALALLRAVNAPLAAPSANRSEQLSPTTAAHVLHSLAGHVDLILDGGPTSGGIESTVVDVRGERPRLLRPGLITREQVEAVVGPVEVSGDSAGIALSPGQHPRHYAPRTPLETVNENGASRALSLLNMGRRVGFLPFGDTSIPAHPRLTTLPMPADPALYAARLYAALHAMDTAGCDILVLEMPPDTPAFLAVRDRLRRAAA